MAAKSALELRVPPVGESITEVVISRWTKKPGDAVQKDETLAVIETDKVTVELPAPEAGQLGPILKGDGEKAQVGEVIGSLRAGAGDAQASGESKAGAKGEAKASEQGATKDTKAEAKSAKQAEPAPAPAANKGGAGAHVMPAARHALAETGQRAEDVEATGPGGRLLVEDVRRSAGSSAARESASAGSSTARESASAGSSAAKDSTSAVSSKAKDSPSSAAAPTTAARAAASSPKAPAANHGPRHEERVAMTPLRKRIAERLVQAQSTAALLTTFNEIDMGAVQELRAARQEQFTQRHGVKLGFMSFFVKAAIDALKLVPQVNARLEGEQIVYCDYQDIGVAVGGGKGLVVPVLRDAERMSFAEVELRVAELAKKAKDNQLSLDDLQGGTFTITNGGIYGSLLSTPIVNPPQSGILGLHAIQERPVARNGQVVIRPMMYVALTYDHRLVDGREAVTFLKRIKECVEDPARMLLEV
jgi:2-oxoglutarate dehydrogenase E2 component (dihydrolipoamide succinyltransferase)